MYRRPNRQRLPPNWIASASGRCSNPQLRLAPKALHRPLRYRNPRPTSQLETRFPCFSKRKTPRSALSFSREKPSTSPVMQAAIVHEPLDLHDPPAKRAGPCPVSYSNPVYASHLLAMSLILHFPLPKICTIAMSSHFSLPKTRSRPFPSSRSPGLNTSRLSFLKSPLWR